MIGQEMGDECPVCKKKQLPPYGKNSIATARACQNCGYVEERREKDGPPAEAVR